MSKSHILLSFLIPVFMLLEFSGWSQGIKVTGVRYLQTNLAAATNQRLPEGSSVPCALVIVEAPSVEGLTFPQAVGNVNHSASQYFVYVKEGIQSFYIESGSGEIITVDFEEIGIDIKSKCTYRIDCAILQKIAVVFNISPGNAVIILDGQEHQAVNGVLSEDFEVGKSIDYVVSAPGYASVSGTLVVKEGENIVSLKLDLNKKPIILSLNTEKANVFVDNEFLGEFTNGDTISVPLRQIDVRVSSDGYEDKTVSFDPLRASSLSVRLNKVSGRIKNQSKTLRPKFSLYFGFGAEQGSEQDEEWTRISLLGTSFEVFLRPWLSLKLAGELNSDLIKKDNTPEDAYKQHVNEVTTQSSQSTDSYSISISGYSVPLQLSLNKPFDYNKGMWSLSAGPSFNCKGITEDEFKYNYWSVRTDLRLSYSHFFIGAALDYSDHIKTFFNLGFCF